MIRTDDHPDQIALLENIVIEENTLSGARAAIDAPGTLDDVLD